LDNLTTKCGIGNRASFKIQYFPHDPKLNDCAIDGQLWQWVLKNPIDTPLVDGLIIKRSSINHASSLSTLRYLQNGYPFQYV
jgi:hypothetical protein